MAFRKTWRRGTGRRSFRAKRRGAWTGNYVQGWSLPAGTVTSWYVWDDIASQRLNLAGRGTVQRVVYWLSCVPNTAGSPTHCGWYFHTYQSDANGIVPTAMIMDPLPTSAATIGIFEHSLMEYQYRALLGPSNLTTPSSQTGMHSLTHVGDLRVKRKIDDTDALLFTIKASNASYLSVAWRVYVSW